MTEITMPDGSKWKLVPIEPTEAMLKAGENTRNDCCIWSLEPGEGMDEFDAKPAYSAMLSAAPTPPAAAIEREMVEKCLVECDKTVRRWSEGPNVSSEPHIAPSTQRPRTVAEVRKAIRALAPVVEKEPSDD